MDYKAAIFDLDGTLIDSNTVWEKIDRIFLEQRGISFSDDFFCELAAMTYEDASRTMNKIGVNIPTEVFKTEVNKLAVHEYSENIKLKSGVREFLLKLKSGGIKIALATASPACLYEPVLKNNGVYDLFDAFTTTDEVGAEKSDPLIYLRSAEKINAGPSDCAVFEDSAKAAATAKKAGFVTIGVYDAYSERDMEKIKGIADKFIQNFNELL